MNKKVIEAIEKFDQLQVRIRLLFTFVLIIIIGLAIDSLWISGNTQKSKRIQNEIRNTEQSINDLINTQKELNNSVVNNKNHPIRKQLEKVNNQLTHLKKQLQDKTINLIKPESMSGVLSEIIQRSNKLKLVSMTKQPPVALFEQENDKAQKNTTEQQVQMYRHLVELVLEGKYADTQNFIDLLENMPQKINFVSMQYEVEDYPKSTIRLVVSTLSLDRKWIGG